MYKAETNTWDCQYYLLYNLFSYFMHRNNKHLSTLLPALDIKGLTQRCQQMRETLVADKAGLGPSVSGSIN